VIISVGMAGFGITQFAGIGHQVATMSEVSVRVARAARLNHSSHGPSGPCG
jgi:hypothetical protein